MSKPTHLFVGGLVAMGFDASGKFLLTVSHSGRGVFSVGTWERVARDPSVTYPTGGKALGIGPLQGQIISVLERDETRDRIEMESFYFMGAGLPTNKIGGLLSIVPKRDFVFVADFMRLGRIAFFVIPSGDDRK